MCIRDRLYFDWTIKNQPYPFGIRRNRNSKRIYTFENIQCLFSYRNAGNREIAVLIFTRNPAGSKSNKSIGRSSDLFRFHAFPALRPVAKIVKRLAPLVGAGTHSNGYCRRFSLHSLFIPHHGPAGVIWKPMRRQIYK